MGRKTYAVRRTTRCDTGCVVRARVLVSGRVQGVFFRASCVAEARARGVTGMVRNTSDGRVEAVFEGEAPQVDAMIAWCGQGPPGARVDGVEVHREPPQEIRGFTVVG
jgi:acylphosphatase